MIVRINLTIILSTLLSGCAFPVRDDEVAWKFAPRTTIDCPDLSGRYDNMGVFMPESTEQRAPPIGLLVLITGTRGNPVYGSRIEFMKLRDPKKAVLDERFVAVVTHTKSDLSITIADQGGTDHAMGTIKLGGHRAFCDGQSLIIRQLINFPNIETGSGSVRYSETVLHKRDDDSIIATTYSAERLRSQLTGKAYGTIDTQSPKTWVFTPAK